MNLEASLLLRFCERAQTFPHPTFPHNQTMCLPQRPSRSGQGRALLARLSQTFYCEGGDLHYV